MLRRFHGQQFATQREATRHAAALAEYDAELLKLTPSRERLLALAAELRGEGAAPPIFAAAPHMARAEIAFPAMAPQRAKAATPAPQPTAPPARPAAALTLEQQWARDPALRAEFVKFEDFAAFTRAAATHGAYFGKRKPKKSERGRA